MRQYWLVPDPLSMDLLGCYFGEQEGYWCFDHSWSQKKTQNTWYYIDEWG
jgi:hypothetical protein